MSENQIAAVVFCVNLTIREHHQVGVHDDWTMGPRYGYDSVSIKLFLNSVAYKLAGAGYRFIYQPGFGDGLLPQTLLATKIAINAKTRDM